MAMLEKNQKDQGQFDPKDNTYVKFQKGKKVKKTNLKTNDLNTISAVTKSINEDLS